MERNEKKGGTFSCRSTRYCWLSFSILDSNTWPSFVLFSFSLMANARLNNGNVLFLTKVFFVCIILLLLQQQSESGASVESVTGSDNNKMLKSLSTRLASHHHQQQQQQKFGNSNGVGGHEVVTESSPSSGLDSSRRSSARINKSEWNGNGKAVARPADRQAGPMIIWLKMLISLSLFL